MEKIKAMVRKLLDRPVLAAIVAAAVAYAVFTLFGYILYFLGNQNVPVYVLVTSIAYVVPVFVAKWLLGRALPLGFGVKGLVWGIIVLLPTYILNILANVVFLAEGGQVSGELTFNAFLGGIQPGVIEELVFRGFAIGNKVRCWRNNEKDLIKAVPVSALIFSLSHLTNLSFALSQGASLLNALAGTMNQVLYTFGFGLLFGAVYLRTRNLLPCIIAHTTMDTFSGITIMLQAQAAQALQEQGLAEAAGAAASAGSAESPFGMTFWQLVINIAFAFFLLRKSKHEQINSLWAAPEEV